MTFARHLVNSLMDSRSIRVVQSDYHLLCHCKTGPIMRGNVLNYVSYSSTEAQKLTAAKKERLGTAETMHPDLAF